MCWSDAYEHPDQARSWSYRYEAWKTPEIISPEALAIYEEVSRWKKVLGWLGVVEFLIAQRKEWVQHKLKEWAWHIIFIVLTEAICYRVTGHEVVWWIIQLISSPR